MASTSSSNSGSAEGDAVAVPTPSSTPWPTRARDSVLSGSDDTCGCWESGATRNCFECLNSQPYAGQDCTIGPLGVCVSVSEADSRRGYFDATYSHTNTTNNVAPHDNRYFYASNATYCQASDAMCSSCRARWINEFRNDSLRSNFTCVGDSGCICTAYCELREAAGITLNVYYDLAPEYCYGSQDNFGMPQKTSPDLEMTRNIMALLIGGLVIILAVRQYVDNLHQRRHDRRMRERRQASREQRNQAGHLGLMLTLEGWNGY